MKIIPHNKSRSLMLCPLLLGLGISLLSKPAHAEESSGDSVQDFWSETTINGDIRSYYFTRNYTNPAAITQASYSLGGNLRILSGTFLSGFQIGAAVYTAQPLGLNSDNIKQVDRSLPGDSVTALGQAYLQYSHPTFLIRGGDQLINTIWLNAADSRMIPATYRGFFGTWTPQKEWVITALRTFEFKSRVSDDFSATNVYDPSNQGFNIPGFNSTADTGAQAIGVAYTKNNFTTQAWAYQFFNYAKLVYGDFQYTFKNKSNINPLIGVQALTEGGDGSNVLAQFTQGAPSSTAYGAVIGAELPRGRITLAYNRIIPDADAFNNGGIASPFTYTSDPLYTTSMIAGLVDKTAGEALRVAAIFFAYEKQLQITTSYAQYYTQPFLHNTDETDFDITYTFKKSKNKYLNGLSIRNRLGIQTGDPTKGTFYYNRVMLQYSF